VEEDYFIVRSVMNDLSSLWGLNSSGLVTTSVRRWTLILSSLTQNMIEASDFSQEKQDLTRLMESPDSKLQEASGMALILLYTLNKDDKPASESDTASVSTNVSSLDEIKDKMRDLSSSKGPKRNKKDRASQKAAFRNIRAFIEDGQVHETKIKLQYGDVLKLTTLQTHVQMDFMKSVLGPGFHRHLHENPLLHSIFNYHPRRISEWTPMSKTEKRAIRSPSSWASKLRTKTRDRERYTKQIYLQS